MSMLQNAHLVTSRKDGRWVYYRLSETFPRRLLAWMKEALADSSDMAADRERLKTIMSCDLHDLCRKQKERRKQIR